MKRNIKLLWYGALALGIVLGLVLIALDQAKPGVKESGSAPETLETREKTDQKLAKVLHVFDGDTFSVRINGKTESVRAIGIDAPETGEKYTKKECFAGGSKTKAIELLGGKSVRLEVDLTQGDKDKYDRLLRYIHLEDGTLFNLEMIKEGFAEEYTFQNKAYKFQSDFLSAQTKAKDAKLGLWGKCNQ